MQVLSHLSTDNSWALPTACRQIGYLCKLLINRCKFMHIYPQTTQNQDNAELFVNCLEAMVETCLPGDDLDVQNPYPSSLGIASHLNLSSSMSSLSMGSLHSPTDKDSSAGAATASSASAADLASVTGVGGGSSSSGGRMRHGSASSSHVQPKMRVGSFKRKNSGGGGSKKKPPPDGFEWLMQEKFWFAYLICVQKGKDLSDWCEKNSDLLNTSVQGKGYGSKKPWWIRVPDTRKILC